MTIIYLVRHGTTDLVGKMLCGTTPGIHLNEEGRQQAQKTAQYLAQLPIKAIYCSPIQRAVDTAEIIGKKLALPVVQQEFLSEIYFGDLQGMMEVDLRNQPLWVRFLNQPGDVAFPNGDSVAETQTRVAEGLQKLALQYEKEDKIVCVAHSEVLRLAIAHVLDLPLDSLHRLTLDTASVSLVEWTPELKKLRLLNYSPA